MTLKIVQAGHPVLRQTARALSLDELASAEIQQLIESMRETMYDAPGVGLAAPQIGLPIQLAVIEDREEIEQRERKPVPFLVLVNPRIIEASEETVEFFEGCLSLTGFAALVKRSRSVVVEHLDEHGAQKRFKANGWFARILQHEIDHLHGRLYIDRMDPRSFSDAGNFKRYWSPVYP